MSAAHAAFSRIATLFVVLTLGVAQAEPGPKTVGPLDVAPEQGGASDVEIAFEHAPVTRQGAPEALTRTRNLNTKSE